MEAEDLIEILEIKEMQSLAFCDIYKEKLSNEDLQKAIDNYCDNMVGVFLEQYKKELQDNTVIVKLRKHIYKIGADKKHSGYRVFEALYKRLKEFENNKKR